MNKSPMAKWRIKYNKAQIAISIPEELHTEFKKTCRVHNTSMTAVLISLIEKYVEENNDGRDNT